MRLLVIMAVIMKNVGTRNLGSFKASVNFYQTIRS
jgi:hypothetical protein